MIFLEDYGIVADGHNPDSTATDNANALEDIIGQISINPASTYIDNGGTMGDVMVPPRGSIMIGRSLDLPNGVIYDGGSAVGSVLRLKNDFDPTKPLFRLGDYNLYNGQRRSSFGTAVRNVTIVDKNEEAAYRVPLLYTDTVQDTKDMFSYVRYYTSKRWGIICESGIGGASFISLNHINGNNAAPETYGVYINMPGSTQVLLDAIEPAAARSLADPNQPVIGTTGLGIRGGRVSLRSFHSEMIDYGCLVDFDPAKGGFLRVYGATGGPASNSVITIRNNLANTDRVSLRDVHKNGAAYTLIDARPGKSNMLADIGRDWLDL
jgi:hypothetical protein